MASPIDSVGSSRWAARSSAIVAKPPVRPGVASPVNAIAWVPVAWLMVSAPILSSTAIRNVGIDSKRNDISVTARSENRYCRTALHAPTSTPMTVPRIVPMTSSRRLTPMRRPNSALTEVSRIVRPRSPRTASCAHAPNRDTTDSLSLRPSAVSWRSTCSAGGGGRRTWKYSRGDSAVAASRYEKNVPASRRTT